MELRDVAAAAAVAWPAVVAAQLATAAQDVLAGDGSAPDASAPDDLGPSWSAAAVPLGRDRSGAGDLRSALPLRLAAATGDAVPTVVDRLLEALRRQGSSPAPSPTCGWSAGSWSCASTTASWRAGCTPWLR
ncbi:hypothetical protein [Arsenicicoccus piscis]|uniref:DUF222 domain-containing protein n=1 Tax=Arsenicicoccus piscis TaxID=673954 RepID=A0ABQ6HRI1_9MICO|nr:hypothetical protein [Arsenicicoccus piscis]GMA20309.1 hypothetical protein GCM10025862_23300 [Arsenicicoccus piscis]